MSMQHGKTRAVGILFVVAICAALLGVSVASGSTETPSSPEGTPPLYPQSTPLAMAVTDDVAFSLIEWHQRDQDGLTVKFIVENHGEFSVGLDTGLISLSIEDRPQTRSTLERADPSLPCSLEPGERVSLTLTFRMEDGEQPASITIGILEHNRSGAKVIVPFAPGAGASAIGGNGVPGSSAPDRTPVLSATPGANACVD